MWMVYCFLFTVYIRKIKKITLSQKDQFSLHFDFRNLKIPAIKTSDGKIYWKSGKISQSVTRW